MSDRRENATAAAKQAAQRAEWLKVPLATRQGIKAGAAERMRQHAANVVRVNRALEAEGLPGSYVMPSADPTTGTPWLDWETGEPLNAVDVLAEAEQRAPQHRRGRWLIADEQRMTSADVVKLGGYAAVCARRMSRGKMGDEDLADVSSDVVAEVLSYGEQRPSTGRELPRWDAIDSADLSGTEQAHAAKGSRDRWRGLAFLRARRAVGAWRDRSDAEQSADWSDPVEDAPTPEQRAADAADQATAYVVESLADASLTAYFLARTAPGGNLRPAERDALALRVAGLSRAELAAARGKSAETIKSNAQRGAKHLAKRLPERADCGKWARRAERRADRVLAAPSEADKLARIMAPAMPSYSPVRLAWPDRMPEYPDSGETVLPTRQGAGWRSSWSLLHAVSFTRPTPRVLADGWQRPTFHDAADRITNAVLHAARIDTRTADSYAPMPPSARRVVPLPPVPPLNLYGLSTADAEQARSAHRAACKRAGRGCAV